MKKLSYLGVLLMAIAIMTSCVKNEEADGVKAMREAQAKLIEAKAGTETLMANANAAYRNALAAVENAKAAVELAKAENQNMETEYQKLLNDAKQLENDLASAKNEMEKERLQAELDIRKAEIAAQKAKMDIELKIALKNLEREKIQAEQDLLDAQKALELAIANTDDEVLNSYVHKYTILLNQIQLVQKDIINKEFDLAEAQLSVKTPLKLKEMNTALLVEKQAELTMKKEYLVKYREVSTNPDELQTKIDEANLRLTEIETERTKLFEEKAPLERKSSILLEKHNTKDDDYNFLFNRLILLQQEYTTKKSIYDYYVEQDLPYMLIFFKKPESMLDGSYISLSDDILSKLNLEDATAGDYFPLSHYEKNLMSLGEGVVYYEELIAEQVAIMAENKPKIDEQKNKFDAFLVFIDEKNSEIKKKNAVIEEQNVIINTNTPILTDANATVAQKTAAQDAIDNANTAITAAQAIITTANEALAVASLDRNAAENLYNYYKQKYDDANRIKVNNEENLRYANLHKKDLEHKVVIVNAVINYLENMGDEASLKEAMEVVKQAVIDKQAEVAAVNITLTAIETELIPINEAIATIDINNNILIEERNYLEYSFLPNIKDAKMNVSATIGILDDEIKNLEQEVLALEKMIESLENTELMETGLINIMKSEIENLKAELKLKQTQADKLKTLIDERLEA